MSDSYDHPEERLSRRQLEIKVVELQENVKVFEDALHTAESEVELLNIQLRLLQQQQVESSNAASHKKELLSLPVDSFDNKAIKDKEAVGDSFNIVLKRCVELESVIEGLQDELVVEKEMAEKWKVMWQAAEKKHVDYEARIGTLNQKLNDLEIKINRKPYQQRCDSCDGKGRVLDNLRLQLTEKDRKIGQIESRLENQRTQLSNLNKKYCHVLNNGYSPPSPNINRNLGVFDRLEDEIMRETRRVEKERKLQAELDRLTSENKQISEQMNFAQAASNAKVTQLQQMEQQLLAIQSQRDRESQDFNQKMLDVQMQHAHELREWQQKLAIRENEKRDFQRRLDALLELITRSQGERVDYNSNYANGNASLRVSGSATPFTDPIRRMPDDVSKCSVGSTLPPLDPRHPNNALLHNSARYFDGFTEKPFPPK